MLENVYLPLQLDTTKHKHLQRIISTFEYASAGTCPQNQKTGEVCFAAEVKSSDAKRSSKAATNLQDLYSLTFEALATFIKVAVYFLITTFYKNMQQPVM